MNRTCINYFMIRIIKSSKNISCVSFFLFHTNVGKHDFAQTFEYNKAGLKHFFIKPYCWIIFFVTLAASINVNLSFKLSKDFPLHTLSIFFLDYHSR